MSRDTFSPRKMRTAKNQPICLARNWKQMRQAQGYALADFWTTQTERDNQAESTIRNPVRDRIRVVDRESLEKM
jgi:hypothetical protein